MRAFTRVTDLVPIFPVVTTMPVPFIERPEIYRGIPLVIGFIDVNNLRFAGLCRGFLPGLFQLQFVPLKALLAHALPLIFYRVIIVFEPVFLRITLAHIDPCDFDFGSFGQLIRIVSNTLVVDPFMHHCSVSRQQNKNHQKSKTLNDD